MRIDYLERTAVAIGTTGPVAAVAVVHLKHPVAIAIDQSNCLASVFQPALELAVGKTDTHRAVSREERLAIFCHDDPFTRSKRQVAKAVSNASIELCIAQIHLTTADVKQLEILERIAADRIVHDFAQAQIALER